MNDGFTPRRLVRTLMIVAGVLALGTVGYRWSLDEPWIQSFYRAVVTSSLTGLDTVPSNDSSRILSIFMVLAGLTIFAYVAAVLVEGIARASFRARSSNGGNVG